MIEIAADDIVDLLTLAAVFDQRTAGPEDVAGWLAVARANRWTLDAAKRAIVDHYGSDAGKPRITPAAITDAIRKIRSAAAATFEDPVVPDDLRGVEYPTWYRAQRDAYVARCLAVWADTGAEPRQQAIEVRHGGGLAGLVEQAPDRVRGEIEQAAARIEARHP
jgi:hypothetical protein